MMPNKPRNKPCCVFLFESMDNVSFIEAILPLYAVLKINDKLELIESMICYIQDYEKQCEGDSKSNWWQRNGFFGPLHNVIGTH